MRRSRAPTGRARIFACERGTGEQDGWLEEASRTKPASISYADADITSGDRAKQRIKMLARKTFNKHVLSEIGGFGGLFALDLEKVPGARAGLLGGRRRDQAQGRLRAGHPPHRRRRTW
jgi:hypothetical protein